jgi:hypothetical protein
MTDKDQASPQSDTGLRRLLTWVFVVLIVTLVFAAVVVELTLRWLGG